MRSKFLSLAACISLCGNSTAFAQGNLDLSSTQKSAPPPPAGSHLFIMEGGRPHALQPGVGITQAESTALNQLLSTGKQSLQLNNSGSAAGGSMTLHGGTSSTPLLSDLVIPKGVDVFANFTQGSLLNFAGTLNNSGKLYAFSTSAAQSLGAIGAQNIINQNGAAITSVLPASVAKELSASTKPFNLSLSASDTFTNNGTISSSGDLAIHANNVDNTLGTMSAGSKVQFTPAAGGSGGVTVHGGILSAPEVDFTAKGAAVNVDVTRIDGAVHVKANTANVVAHQGDLNLARVDLSGDPIFYLGGGGTLALGNTTTFGDIVVLSSGDIVTQPNTQLSTAGGNLTLWAGYDGPAPAVQNDQCVFCAGHVNTTGANYGGTIILQNTSIDTGANGANAAPFDSPGNVLIKGDSISLAGTISANGFQNSGGGTVAVKAHNVLGANGLVINANGGNTRGDGGTVDLDVSTEGSGAVILHNTSIHVDTLNGNAGSISVKGNSAWVGGDLTANASLSGNGGNITVESTSTAPAGTFGVGSSVTDGVGGSISANGGSLYGDAGAISLRGDSPHSQYTPSQIQLGATNGNGGSLSIRGNAVTIASGTLAASAAGTNYDGGSIKLDVGSLSVSSGNLSLQANGSGAGDGGTVDIRASGPISIGAGNGAISLSATGGQAGAETGAGGLVKIQSSGTLDFDSTAVSVSPQGSVGAGAMIILDGSSVNVSGPLTAHANGTGTAGSITVNGTYYGDSFGGGGHPVVSLADLDLTNPATVTNIQALQLQGILGGQLVVTGGVASGGTLLVNPGADLSSLNSVNIPAGVMVELDGFRAPNVVSSQTASVSGSLFFNTVGGRADGHLQVAGDLSVASSGAVTSSGSLSVNGGVLSQGSVFGENGLDVSLAPTSQFNLFGGTFGSHATTNVHSSGSTSGVIIHNTVVSGDMVSIALGGGSISADFSNSDTVNLLLGSGSHDSASITTQGSLVLLGTLAGTNKANVVNQPYPFSNVSATAGGDIFTTGVVGADNISLTSSGNGNLVIGAPLRTPLGVAGSGAGSVSLTTHGQGIVVTIDGGDIETGTLRAVTGTGYIGGPNAMAIKVAANRIDANTDADAYFKLVSISSSTGISPSFVGTVNGTYHIESGSSVVRSTVGPLDVPVKIFSLDLTNPNYVAQLAQMQQAHPELLGGHLNVPQSGAPTGSIIFKSGVNLSLLDYIRSDGVINVTFDGFGGTHVINELKPLGSGLAQTSRLIATFTNSSGPLTITSIAVPVRQDQPLGLTMNGTRFDTDVTVRSLLLPKGELLAAEAGLGPRAVVYQPHNNDLELSSNNINVTGSATFVLDGQGGIVSTNGGGVNASSIAVHGVHGSIGTPFNSVPLNASSLDIIAGSAYVTSSGDIVVTGSRVSNDFSLLAQNNVQISGLQQVGGSVSIVAANSGTGSLLIAPSTLLTSGGNLLLETKDTQSGQIVFGSDSNIKALQNVVVAVNSSGGPQSIGFTPGNVIAQGDIKFGTFGVLTDNNNPLSFIVAEPNSSIAFNSDNSALATTAIKVDGNVAIGSGLQDNPQHSLPPVSAVTLGSLDLTDPSVTHFITQIQTKYPSLIGGALTLNGGVATGGDIVLSHANLGHLSAINIPGGVSASFNGLSGLVDVELTPSSHTQQALFNGTQDFNDGAWTVNVSSSSGSNNPLLVINGSISGSATALSMNAAGSILVNNNVSLPSGALSIATTNGGDISLAGGAVTLSAGKSIYLHADQNLAIDPASHLTVNAVGGDTSVAIGAAGSLNISNANGGISISAPGTNGTAAGVVSIQSGNNVTVDLAALNVASGTTNSAGANLTISAMNQLGIKGTTIDVTGRGAAGSLTLSAGQLLLDASGPSLIVTQDVNTGLGGTASLTSSQTATDFTVGNCAGCAVIHAANVTVSNSRGVTVDTTYLLSTTNLTLNAGYNNGSGDLMVSGNSLSGAASPLQAFTGSANGSVSIHTSGPLQLANATVTAHGGDVNLLSDTSIDIDNSSVLAEADFLTEAHGGVNIAINNVPASPSPGNEPDFVTEHFRDGGNINYGANGITVNGPEQTNISALGKNVVFSTDTASASAITVHNSNITASLKYVVFSNLDLSSPQTIALVESLQAAGKLGGTLTGTNANNVAGNVIIAQHGINLDSPASVVIPANVTVSLDHLVYPVTTQSATITGALTSNAINFITPSFSNSGSVTADTDGISITALASGNLTIASSGTGTWTAPAGKPITFAGQNVSFTGNQTFQFTNGGGTVSAQAPNGTISTGANVVLDLATNGSTFTPLTSVFLHDGRVETHGGASTLAINPIAPFTLVNHTDLDITGLMVVAPGVNVAIASSGSITGTHTSFDLSSNSGAGGSLNLLAGMRFIPSGLSPDSFLLQGIIGVTPVGNLTLHDTVIDTTGATTSGSVQVLANHGGIDLGTVNTGTASGATTVIGPSVTFTSITSSNIVVAAQNAAPNQGFVELKNAILPAGTFQANSGQNLGAGTGDISAGAMNAGTGQIRILTDQRITHVTFASAPIAHGLFVNAGKGTITLPNSAFSVLPDSSGNGGTITLSAGSLQGDSASPTSLSLQAVGTAAGGIISVHTTDSLVLGSKPGQIVMDAHGGAVDGSISATSTNDITVYRDGVNIGGAGHGSLWFFASADNNQNGHLLIAEPLNISNGATSGVPDVISLASYSTTPFVIGTPSTTNGIKTTLYDKTANADVFIEANSAVLVRKPFTAVHNLLVRSDLPGSSVSFTGAVTAQNNLTIMVPSGGSLVSGKLTAPNISLMVDSVKPITKTVDTSNLTVHSNSAAALHITNVGKSPLTASIQAQRLVSLTSSTSITLGNIVAGPSSILIIRANGLHHDLHATGAISGGPVTITAGGAFTADPNTTITSGALTVTAAGVTVDNVSAQGPIKITSNGLNLDVNGNITANSTILRATPGITLTDTNAHGVVNIAAGSIISNSGPGKNGVRISAGVGNAGFITVADPNLTYILKGTSSSIPTRPPFSISTGLAVSGPVTFNSGAATLVVQRGKTAEINFGGSNLIKVGNQSSSSDNGDYILETGDDGVDECNQVLVRNLKEK